MATVSSPAVNDRPDPSPEPSYFYLRYWQHEGISMPEEVGGTAESLRFLAGNNRDQIERLEFEEIQDPKRFCVAEWRWGPKTVDWRPDYAEGELKKAYNDYRRRAAEWPDPVSFLDVPGGDEEGLEWSDDDDSFFQTRDEALLRAAELNGKSLAGALAGDGKLTGIYWYVVVELGKPVMSGLVCLRLCANGMGGCHRQMNWPVRLVRPTEAERAQYPAPELVEKE